MDVVGVLVIECGVASSAVVEAFNVGDYIASGLLLGGVNRAVDTFVLEG